MSAIAEQIAEAASRPLSRAPTLPPRAYTDGGHFAREADAILRAEWICIAHVSQLAAVGDDVAVEPVERQLEWGLFEDMQVSSAVQRGLRSAHAVRGRRSHLEEMVWLIQRNVARRLAEHYA